MLHVDNVLFEISEGEVFGLLFQCGVLLAIGIRFRQLSNRHLMIHHHSPHPQNG